MNLSKANSLTIRFDGERFVTANPPISPTVKIISPIAVKEPTGYVASSSGGEIPKILQQSPLNVTQPLKVVSRKILGTSLDRDQQKSHVKTKPSQNTSSTINSKVRSVDCNTDENQNKFQSLFQTPVTNISKLSFEGPEMKSIESMRKLSFKSSMDDLWKHASENTMTISELQTNANEISVSPISLRPGIRSQSSQPAKRVSDSRRSSSVRSSILSDKSRRSSVDSQYSAHMDSTLSNSYNNNDTSKDRSESNRKPQLPRFSSPKSKLTNQLEVNAKSKTNVKDKHPERSKVDEYSSRIRAMNAPRLLKQEIKNDTNTFARVDMRIVKSVRENPSTDKPINTTPLTLNPRKQLDSRLNNNHSISDTLLNNIMKKRLISPTSDKPKIGSPSQVNSTGSKHNEERLSNNTDSIYRASMNLSRTSTSPSVFIKRTHVSQIDFQSVKPSARLISPGNFHDNTTTNTMITDYANIRKKLSPQEATNSSGIDDVVSEALVQQQHSRQPKSSVTMIPRLSSNQSDINSRHRNKQISEKSQLIPNTDKMEWLRFFNWLNTVNMSQYAELFANHGINKLSLVELLQLSDLNEIFLNNDQLTAIDQQQRRLHVEKLYCHIQELSRQTTSVSQLAMNENIRPHTPSILSLSNSSDSNQSQNRTTPVRVCLPEPENLDSVYTISKSNSIYVTLQLLLNHFDSGSLHNFFEVWIDNNFASQFLNSVISNSSIRKSNEIQSVVDLQLRQDSEPHHNDLDNEVCMSNSQEIMLTSSSNALEPCPNEHVNDCSLSFVTTPLNESTETPILNSLSEISNIENKLSSRISVDSNQILDCVSGSLVESKSNDVDKDLSSHPHFDGKGNIPDAEINYEEPTTNPLTDSDVIENCIIPVITLDSNDSIGMSSTDEVIETPVVDISPCMASSEIIGMSSTDEVIETPVVDISPCMASSEIIEMSSTDEVIETPVVDISPCMASSEIVASTDVNNNSENIFSQLEQQSDQNNLEEVSRLSIQCTSLVNVIPKPECRESLVESASSSFEAPGEGLPSNCDSEKPYDQKLMKSTNQLDSAINLEPPNHSFVVSIFTLLTHIVDIVSSRDFQSLSKFHSEVEPTSHEANITMEYYLLLYFTIQSIKCNKNPPTDECLPLLRQFIEIVCCGQAINGQSYMYPSIVKSIDFGKYSGLVFHHHPQDNSLYSQLFTPDWAQFIRKRLEYFFFCNLFGFTFDENIMSKTSLVSSPLSRFGHHEISSPILQSRSPLNIQSGKLPPARGGRKRPVTDNNLSTNSARSTSNADGLIMSSSNLQDESYNFRSNRHTSPPMFSLKQQILQYKRQLKSSS